MSTTVEIKCSKCGKKLISYDPTLARRQYKSPVKQCKSCGSHYADPRCHEIAVEGLPEDTFKVSSYAIMMAFGALITYRGAYMFQRHQLGVPDSIQWLLPTVFLLGGILMVIFGLYEIITIKTGVKQKKYDKLQQESEQRLQDKSYAYLLKDLGYPIPEKYL